MSRPMLIAQSTRSLSFLSRLFGGGSKRVLVGTDQDGNRYFEESQGPDRRPKRIIWAPDQSSDDGTTSVPVPTPEWDSWLRHRRPDPPSQAELAANARLAAQKAERGAEIMRRDRDRREARLRSGELHQPEDSKPENVHSSATFPQYRDAEFEEYPGAGRESAAASPDGRKKK